MTRYHVRVLLSFAALRTIALALHCFGPSPWGGPAVLSPWRLFPDVLLHELGLLGVVVLAGAGFERLAPLRWRSTVRAFLLVLLASHLMLAQFDLEIVRWMGQHVSVSYLRNFFGVRDPHLLGRILSGDRAMTGIAVLLLLGAPAIALWIALRPRARDTEVLGRRAAWTLSIVALVAVLAPAWFRPSEKRWRRLRPAVVGMAGEILDAAAGIDDPRDPERAERDLVDWVRAGRLDAGTVPSANPSFPLFTDSNVGTRTPDQFRARPRDERPNIVVIVFETMRGWNTGMLPDSSLPSGTPELDALLEEGATRFPWAHSNGYPSVEGCMAMHLSIWPHFERIVFSDFLHVRTRAFPEHLRDLGYRSWALLGADPSFSNFTPWFRRWYDEWEYTPANRHDGPLADRFLARYDETAQGDTPLLALLWTATTHPPYDIPESEGIPIADSDEARFDQAIRYADRHVSRIIRALRDRPDWNRTVVVILGDHAQPTPWQRQHADEIGELNPGHTWTQIAILGGWPGLPPPRLRTDQVSHLDLAPTLLGLLDVRVPNHFMGRNLFAAGGDVERPLMAFRYGEIALVQERDRTNFRLRGDDVIVHPVVRDRELDYGLLEGNRLPASRSVPPDLDLARVQDLVRAWGRVLTENRVMPPEPEAPAGR